MLHTNMFCHLQGLPTITSSCWQCNLRLMLSMLCLQCPAMYNVPCTTAWLLYVRLMENGPVSSSASLTICLSFCYCRHTNGWSYLMMMNREQQRRNSGRRLRSSWQRVLRMTLKIKMVLRLHWVQTTFPSLCKAHTVEALDISNINVLASLESSLKFTEAPESINACVKSFVRGEESVVNWQLC